MVDGVNLICGGSSYCQPYRSDFAFPLFILHTFHFLGTIPFFPSLKSGYTLKRWFICRMTKLKVGDIIVKNCAILCVCMWWVRLDTE